jgi:Protein of unknown function (DUF3987)
MTVAITLPNSGRAFVTVPMAHSIAWPMPDMEILTEGRRPAPPFPTDILGPVWSEWVIEAAEDKGAPVDYVTAALLATTSALIGNSRWVTAWRDRQDAWREPSVIWCASIGSPSSGKSPANDAVLDLVSVLDLDMAETFPEMQRDYDTDKEAARIRRKTWESQVEDAVKAGHVPPQRPANADEPPAPTRPRIRIMDATPEANAALLAVNPRGLLLHRDELAGYITGFGRYGTAGADRAFAIESYGGRPFVIDRRKQNGEPLISPRVDRPRRMSRYRYLDQGRA